MGTVVPKAKQRFPKAIATWHSRARPMATANPDVTVRFISRGKAKVIKR